MSPWRTVSGAGRSAPSIEIEGTIHVSSFSLIMRALTLFEPKAHSTPLEKPRPVTRTTSPPSDEARRIETSSMVIEARPATFHGDEKARPSVVTVKSPATRLAQTISVSDT